MAKEFHNPAPSTVRGKRRNIIRSLSEFNKSAKPRAAEFIRLGKDESIPAHLRAK